MNQKEYAAHMLSWIDILGAPRVDIAAEALDIAKRFWLLDESVNFSEIKIKLWNWVDSNDGLRRTANEDMIKIRMLICLMSETVEEVQEMGFFEELLVNLGFSYKEAYAGT